MTDEPPSKPVCTVIAGPNGSGKSSIYPLLSPVGEYINADVVARNLDSENPEAMSLAAGRLVLKAIDEAMRHRRSFVYETTLSSRQSIAVMERCKALSYEISLVFVVLDSPELNVRRVAERVARGGHDIPEKVIRRRYDTAFGRLPDALKLADGSLIIDNSRLAPEMILILEGGRTVASCLDESNAAHRLLMEALAKISLVSGK